MASVVMHKSESYVDIIPENDCYIPPEQAQESTNFGLFDLPDLIAVKIVSHLNLQDTNAVANTCRIGRQIAQDQLMWRNKLWIWAKVQNLSLSPSQPLYPSAMMLIRDPLLMNNKELYKMLELELAQSTNMEALDYGNLLSKMPAPPPTSMGFIEYLLEALENFFSGMFGNTVDVNQTTDPLSKGEGAPTFLLFGTQETKVCKKLALSFIASKNSTFETVGHVKGKPGGVTVRYGQQLMNLLTVRRARPKPLVQGQQGTTFHPDVAEVAARVDGLICYMDATCWCSEREQTSNKKAEDPDGKFISSGLGIDVLELEAMLKTIPPNLAPPILLLLAHTDGVSNSTSECETHEGERASCSRHSPAWLHPIMARLDLPWAICEVEVSSLSGVHQGLNWLLKRTLKNNNR